MNVTDEINAIERLLAHFYGFDLVLSANDHLLDFKDLQQQSTLTSLPSKDGCVVLHQSQSDSEEVFLGLGISQSLRENIAKTKPLEALSEDNLNPFCVLVEEISHFHLLVNRLNRSQTVTQLELEWQAEVDKLLICAHVLFHQHHNNHCRALLGRLYDQSKITSVTDDRRYWVATKFAQIFWERFIRANARSQDEMSILHNTSLRDLLRPIYHAAWEEKLQKIFVAA